MTSFKKLFAATLIAGAGLATLSTSALAYGGRDTGIDGDPSIVQMSLEMRAIMAKLAPDKMAKAMAMEDKLMQMEMESKSMKMKMDMDLMKARRELEMYIMANRQDLR